MIADKIKLLREKAGITQAELARRLGVTRSGMNAWEMGISEPSTKYIAKLATLFKVSTDFLLDMPSTKTINIDGLTDRQVASIVEIIDCFKSEK